MKTLILALSLTFLSAPAFAKNVDPSCGGSKLMLRGTIYLAFALSEEPTATGDEAYDRLLSEGVRDKFSKEDTAAVRALLDSNPNLGMILAVKGDEFREKGLKGSHYMNALVDFYQDPANGLCSK